MPLADIDWTNAVFIPLTIALTAGVALSIYTGLVASRAFAYTQCRLRVLLWATDVTKLIRQGGPTTYAEFALELVLKSAPVFGELQSLGHSEARDVVFKEMDSLLSRAAKLSGASVGAKQEIIKDADLPPNFADEMMNPGFIGGDRISNIKPNLFAILSPDPFPAYIGHRNAKGWMDGYAMRRSDCGNCCENCKRVL